MKYQTIKRFAETSGYTEKAIRRKLEEGVWIMGVHAHSAPDGRIMIDTEKVERWVEGQREPLSRGKRTSASSSRTTAAAA